MKHLPSKKSENFNQNKIIAKISAMIFQLGERYFKRNISEQCCWSEELVVPLATMLTWQKELSRERRESATLRGQRNDCSRVVQQTSRSVRGVEVFLSLRLSLLPGKIFFVCFYSFPRIEDIPRRAMERVGCRKPTGTSIEGNASEGRATADEI